MNIKEKVKSYEDACEVLGREVNESIPFAEPKNQFQTAINALAKLMVIAEALNEGWKPDWTNYNQYKYYAWFDMDEVSAASRFSFYVFIFEYSGSALGSRLVFKSRDLAEYAGRHFIDLYRDWMVIPD